MNRKGVFGTTLISVLVIIYLAVIMGSYLVLMAQHDARYDRFSDENKRIDDHIALMSFLHYEYASDQSVAMLIDEIHHNSATPDMLRDVIDSFFSDCVAISFEDIRIGSCSGDIVSTVIPSQYGDPIEVKLQR